MKTYALAVIFTLLHITPSYGQGIQGLELPSGGYLDGLGLGGGVGSGGPGGTIGNLAGMGLGFGGNEIPVRDSRTRAETAITALKTTALLVDALKNSLIGNAPGNGSTLPLLLRQALSAAEKSLWYGEYHQDQWDSVYRQSVVYEHGEYADEEAERDRRRMQNSADAMQAVKLRSDEMPEDASRMGAIKAELDDCKGRLCAAQVGHTAAVESAMQSLHVQQLLMTLITAQANDHAGMLNDQLQRKAQARYITTHGWPTQLVDATDHGLW